MTDLYLEALVAIAASFSVLMAGAWGVQRQTGNSGWVDTIWTFSLGLVAAGLHPNPVPHADVVTFTTHKALRGPRGAMIVCKEEHAKEIDRKLFPGVQGGPLVHIIAAKAVALGEAVAGLAEHRPPVLPQWIDEATS